MQRKDRNSNIEWLRIISMLMIVALHYNKNGGGALYASGLLYNLKFGDRHYLLVWLFESLCLVAVNCYVLISGWFLSAKAPKPRKLIPIVLQTFLYSVGIYLIACASGVVEFNLKTMVIFYLFPLIRGEYWFMTVYVVLVLLSPYLNRLIGTLEKKEHLRLVLASGIILSAIPTVFYFGGDSLGNKDGYSLLWFAFLYILAAYLRMYPIDFKLPGKHLIYASIYIIASLLTLGSKLLQNLVLSKEYWNFYKYNSLTVLAGSVALFLIFVSLPEKHHRLPIVIGSTTLGVFLIHNQYVIRDNILWNKIVVPLDYIGGSTLAYLGHFVLSVVGIFVVCSIIDLIRTGIFMAAGKGIKLLQSRLRRE
ncbi:MAG: acyltransferase family protein [Clostridiales bacterium]|nr:acyltransferase family protein [Clostridiales bacterium]